MKFAPAGGPRARHAFAKTGSRARAFCLASFVLYSNCLTILSLNEARDAKDADYSELVSALLAVSPRGSNAASLTPAGPKFIFQSSTPVTGSLGGVPGADAICNADGLKPANSGTYKAMVVVTGVRVASVTANAGDGQIDWVLRPNQSYIRPDGTPIMTTNASGIYIWGADWPASVGTNGNAIWTGLMADWRVDGTRCSNWTDNISTFGRYATANAVNSMAILSGSLHCSNTGNLYCVQQ